MLDNTQVTMILNRIAALIPVSRSRYNAELVSHRQALRDQEETFRAELVAQREALKAEYLELSNSRIKPFSEIAGVQS